MSRHGISFSVFTKPWKGPIEEVARFVSGVGFDGIELPVRPGFQVEPQNVTRDLPSAARRLDAFGLKIYSVAGPTDEATIATCAELGIPIIRVMVAIGDDGYRATEEQVRRDFDRMIPLLDRHGVKVGVQNHNGNFISNASGLRHLIESYDPRHVCAVWDAAHNALNGEAAELALDIIWPHLGMVNLKNAYWERINGPEAEVASWRIHWTTGRHGLASWTRVATELNRRDYKGVVCLTAEYSDEEAVNRLVAEDLAYAKTLF